MSWSDSELDALLRDACEREPIDTSAVERSIRSRIRRRVVRWQWIAAATLVIGILELWNQARVPGVFEQAARDHREEVVQHSPRRWRTDNAAIDGIARRFGFSADQAAQLAPAGYHLEQAKICGLEGKPALHLVYAGADTLGAREFSVYIAKITPRQRQKTVDGFTVMKFRSGIVVGTKAECEAVAGSRA